MVFDVVEALAQSLAPGDSIWLSVGQAFYIHKDNCGDQERSGIDKQCVTHAYSGNEHASYKRCKDGPPRERQVQQRVTRAQLSTGFEYRSRRGPDKRTATHRKCAVEECDQGDQGKNKVVGQDCEQDEETRLNGVNEGQAPSCRQRLDTGGKRRCRQRRKEPHRDEEQCCCERAAGLVKDENRKSNVANPVADDVYDLGRP